MVPPQRIQLCFRVNLSHQPAKILLPVIGGMRKDFIVRNRRYYSAGDDHHNTKEEATLPLTSSSSCGVARTTRLPVNIELTC
ncbi:unnamed protein product [Pseudo-nitzschia multistriata]|uniref:Uncharacterized protein n=1 Tax=Pseudo-nitzschia multistriata TaxID=183589 RepID=A0A448ZS94_9STRA|nr:unnamed protein product [Pseudo-nitzschia multistriata]